MKKLVLTSAALMAFAAASYAQLIQQNGQQQFARQNQVGVNQNGTIQQLQNATPALGGVNYGNYAITFQGTPQNNGANTLFIQQNDGSQGNRAGISQSGGPDLNATIQQNGGVDGLSGGATSTSATQNVRGEDGNFAGILQLGSSSTATIGENNNSRRNSAETYQNGSQNVATTNQNNNSVSNSAFVFQGFTGQNVQGTAVTNVVARIQQGKLNATDVVVAGSSVNPETLNSTAVITQTASNVTATINQGAFFTSTIGSGRANGVDARINQSAIGNTAIINQGVQGAEAIGSKATINQTSANNTAQITQGLRQTASDNQSTAIITQSGTATPGSALSVFIDQGDYGATDGNQATVTQTSTSADASVTIYQGFGIGSYSSGDIATVTQGGRNVSTYIGQQDVNGSGESNGRDNNALVTQATGVTSGTALIEQGNATTGQVFQVNRNKATVTQTAGTNLRARIGQADFQLGDANRTSFTVNGLNGVAVTLSGLIANDNTASISQVSGDNHNANIFQTGRFNQATITQSSGNGSQALVVQTANSERAQAIINQTANGGTNNQATILQFAGSNADGRGSFGNQAIINQTVGSGNIALIQQGQQGVGVVTSSNDNFAQVTQNGSTNQARFLQVGNNNFVDITQNGNNNQLLGTLASGQNFGSQQGYNNRLSLVQNGGSVGLTFRYTQVGNNQTQEVVQNLNP